jgi:hypothetical protein
VKSYHVTEEHLNNLEKLAAYLKGGTLRAAFNMKNYSDDTHINGSECGTVGCAVGHGPFLGFEKKPGENWTSYSYRVFGLVKEDWMYAFGAQWYLTDNTPEGAAARILELVAKYQCRPDLGSPSVQRLHKMLTDVGFTGPYVENGVYAYTNEGRGDPCLPVTSRKTYYDLVKVYLVNGDLDYFLLIRDVPNETDVFPEGDEIEGVGSEQYERYDFFEAFGFFYGSNWNS